MTVRVVGALRRMMGIAARRGPRRATPVFLATLLAACAAKELPVNQDLTLKFGDTTKKYAVGLGDNVKHEVPQGSVEVHVRISGERVTKITVYAYENGEICGSTEVTVEPEEGRTYDVTVECKHLAPADAGPPLMSDASPDLSPDVSPDTGPSPACQAYCKVMGEHCPDVYLGDERDCLATCAAYGWPAGGPSSGNNDIQCRIDSALVTPAPNDLIRCYRAGPTGGNRCAPLCQNYCDAAVRNCPGLMLGDGKEACMDACVSKYGLTPTPALRSDKGDTIECRIFWLGQAGKDGGKSCALLAEDAQDSPCRN